MKGLLLKDWYMMKRYCRYYLFATVVFIILSLMTDGNMFFVFYPCMLCGMIPVNLIGYDERSRWLEYSGTMPYTKAQIVSGKYVIGSLVQFTTMLAIVAAQAVKMTAAGNFIPGKLAVLILLVLIVSTLSSSICLPFIFKLGMEKGRTAYYVMIGFVCGASALVSGLLADQPAAEILPNIFLVLLAAVSIGVYALSWYMSIVFFKKREIQ